MSSERQLIDGYFNKLRREAHKNAPKVVVIEKRQARRLKRLALEYLKDQLTQSESAAACEEGQSVADRMEHQRIAKAIKREYNALKQWTI